MSQTTVIRNAQLVNEGLIVESDILLKNGRIEKIAPAVEAPAGAEVVDANGRHLLPGMIDDQVHFREPGLTHKGDFYSESRAAIAGGVTSYMEMPNSKPPTTDIEQLNGKMRRPSGWNQPQASIVVELKEQIPLKVQQIAWRKEAPEGPW